VLLIVDRLEERWAVLEWEEGTFNFPRQLLPADVREGDVLDVALKRDEAATRRRSEEARKALDDLLAPRCESDEHH